MGKNGKTVKKENKKKPGKGKKLSFFKILEMIIIFAAALVIFYLYYTDKNNKLLSQREIQHEIKKKVI